MQNIRNDSRVVSFVGRTGIKSLLLTVLEQLQRCQKALNEFLEVLYYADTELSICVLFINHRRP